jgi:predicted small secreted protein
MKTTKTNNPITLVQRLVLWLLVTGFLAVVGVGCQTAHGFGEDVQKAGEKIQDGTK